MPPVKHEVYSVAYDSESHIGVITQRKGSLWPKVLPYCLLNVALSIVLQVLKSYDIVDLSITDKGHSLMTMFVAFLIVSRVNISLGRYNEARANLGAMYREARELIQNVAVFTKEDQSQGAQEWRHELAYRLCILLRLSMAVIDYPTTAIPSWKIPELQGEPKEEILKTLNSSDNRSSQTPMRWAHTDRGEGEENMRVPIRMAYLLRTTIYSSRHRLATPLGAWQYGKLFGSVDGFLGGYYGMRKFMTTPFPFPLVQMARTFLFAYIYTLPFALLSDSSKSFAHLCVIFMVTYGFVGLETVSIELDDPFGDDENDFDNLGMALTAFEDTYLTVLDVDGPEWTDKLRALMKGADEYDNPQDVPSERSWLLSNGKDSIV